MKTLPRPFPVVGPVALLAVLAVAGAAGRALALPFPLVALGLLLLGLRLGVMAAALEEPAAEAVPAVASGARGPALRAANG
jgi:hypothetical protein